MPWILRSSCKKTLVSRMLSRHIDTLLKMADCVQKQASKPWRKRSKCFMKNKTIPGVELTEAPATPVPVLTSSNKKLALSTQSSASESGPSTSGAGNEELQEGAGDLCFIMNTQALHLIAKTFQCCGSELEVKKDFSCRRGWVAKISLSCSHCKKEVVVTDPYRKEDVSVNSRATLAMRAIGKGRSALQTFSGVMGMLLPVCAQAYISHNKNILEASRELLSLNCCCWTLCSARDDELVDVKVTCDGTWSKRGFTTLWSCSGSILGCKQSFRCRTQQEQVLFGVFSTSSDGWDLYEFMDWWEEILHQGWSVRELSVFGNGQWRRIRCVIPQGRPAGEERRQALQYNRVELEEQSINEEGETYCAGGLIEVLDTSKYHCVYVLCPSMHWSTWLYVTQTLTTIISKQDISTCQRLHSTFFKHKLYIIYHSVALSLLY